jgi:hypothetical protein
MALNTGILDGFSSSTCGVGGLTVRNWQDFSPSGPLSR